MPLAEVGPVIKETPVDGLSDSEKSEVGDDLTANVTPAEDAPLDQDAHVDLQVETSPADSILSDETQKEILEE